MALVEMNATFLITSVSDEFVAKLVGRKAAVGTDFVEMFEEEDRPRHHDGFIGAATLEGGTAGGAASDSGAASSEAEELKDFFNKGPIALHWLSATGKVLWANDRELEVLGYSRDEYIGADIMTFCPDSRDEVLEIFKELGTGNTIRDVPIRFRTKDGRIKHLLIDSNVNYKSDGAFNHTRCFIRDDTGRILKECRSEVAETAARKLAEGKERFSSKLLHALAALSGLVASVSKAMKFHDGYVVKPAPTSFGLSSLVGEYRNVETARHEVAVQEIGFDPSLVVVADAVMIRTVLNELVAHADGRSPVSARVVLSVERIAGAKGDGGGAAAAAGGGGGGGGGEGGGAERGKFEFRVTDSGEELDEARVEKVFHNYWLGDADVLGDGDGESADLPRLSQELSCDEEAPGLRLNVAFNYVQCLDSILRVVSDGSSTTFKFVLDLETSSSGSQDKPKREARAKHDKQQWDKISLSSLPPISPRTAAQSFAGSLYNSDSKHILIVEDNTICQKMCKRIVTGFGHTVDTADNGAIAVEKATAKELSIYDLVLMDLRMPVMDGITAAKEIHKKFPELPIVALSAEDGESAKDAALAVMVAFMSKPTNAARVGEVIQKYATSRHPLGRMAVRKCLPGLGA
ncbi:unnamed protein product [Ectocarpus fasciculatus]